jgi:hypothetical protein
MGRLVVGGVLPSNGFAILPIMHEGVEAVRRSGRGGKYHQLGVIAAAQNQFFAPITEKVGRKAWV